MAIQGLYDCLCCGWADRFPFVFQAFCNAIKRSIIEKTEVAELEMQELPGLVTDPEAAVPEARVGAPRRIEERPGNKFKQPFFVFFYAMLAFHCSIILWSMSYGRRIPRPVLIIDAVCFLVSLALIFTLHAITPTKKFVLMVACCLTFNMMFLGMWIIVTGLI